MIPVLEAVPNFSEGRDVAWLESLVHALGRTGVEVLDWTADPDHNRSVVTFVGDPASVEAAAIEAARRALERIDLREHVGVHPRVGAVDVLPFVPLSGLAMADAVRSARRVGAALAELGLPVYFYGEASHPPGRRLSELRRGGFEAIAGGFPPDRLPDLPAGRTAAHPTAGAACVGARPVLLAWNVYVEGVDLERLRALARELREQDGGFATLRALAFRLASTDRLQLSMNLEDAERTSPFAVFARIEERVRSWGGRVTGTEVIGMIPDALVLPAAADRLLLLDSPSSRLLSTRLARHVAERAARHAEALLQAVRDEGDAVPEQVREAAFRLSGALTPSPSRDRDR